MSINHSPEVANHLFADISSIHGRMMDIERRVKSIESALTDDKQRAHMKAKQKNAREVISRGQTVALVIQKNLEDEENSALSKFEGIYTFIDTGSFALQRGDTVRAKFVDVGDNHAEAIALEISGGEEADV